MRRFRLALSALCLSLPIVGAPQWAHAQQPGPAAVEATPTPASQPVERVAYPAKSPATWLSSEGKGDPWYTDTVRCRELLDKLDPDAAVVQKHLARVRSKCEMVRRVESFSWKSRTAVEFLEGILEDLVAGKEPLVRYAGKQFAYPYWSETMRMIQANWMHVPPAYDPAKSHQLFIYYKCGGGIHFRDGKAAGGHRPTADNANQTDTFHAWSSLSTQIKGRMGGEIELQEFPAALAEDFSVSPDRVFLTGWSDGGFTATWLGAHYPHLVAGIAPCCGNWQYTNVEDAGASNIPVLAIDGWSDGGYNVLQFNRWQVLRGWGADVSCIWGHHGHTYQPYEDIEEFKSIIDWAATKRRDLWPKRVRYATWNLYTHRAYWVDLERMIDPTLACQIEAEVKPGNRIEVTTRNLAAYTLTLHEKLVDPTQPVTIVTDGKESYAGPFQERIAVVLVPPPAAPFVKTAALPDDIAAATVGSSYDADGFLAIPGRRWLAVKATGCDENTAGLLAKWFPEGAKADTEVTADDHANYNLFLYGGPEINKVTAGIADRLPIQFGNGTFTVGQTVYDQPTHCVGFLHPNPLNPQKYVIVYGFNDAAAFAKGGFFGMTGESVWKFRSGDAVIGGIPSPRRGFGVGMDAAAYESRRLAFGPDWRPDGRPPIAEVEQPFDYLQLLRLRADAIRAAAEADVGVIWSHTPGHKRWRDSMPAGPITAHDLATQDAFPEYVCVGSMPGSRLIGARKSAAACSIRADRSEPGYVAGQTLAVADIDPSKTYRVAMGYHGTPCYDTTIKKMPRLFTWSTQEEFLADTNNKIIIQDLTQTPIQVAEAVANYVTGKKKVAPRPMCFDLTEYIANPRDNEFGACDWLHLGIDVAWQPDKTDGDRYTLALGARVASDPAVAPPRKNAKQFAELPLAAGASPGSFDFASMDKQLPLTATTKVSRYAVNPDADFKTFTLSETAAEGSIGEAILAELRLANEGPADLAVTCVLADTVMRSFRGSTWPEDGAKASAKNRPAYFGYHRAVARAKQPATHENAALVFSEAKSQKLIVPNAGYNFGLVGLEAPLVVKAGETVTVPLLLIAVDRPAAGPDISLATVLESIAGDLAQRP